MSKDTFNNTEHPHIHNINKKKLKGLMVIFPATDSELKSLNEKELWYGYFMDMPDENLMVVLEDRAIEILCDKPKIHKVTVHITENKIDMKLKIDNHLEEFAFDDEDVYTGYPLYNKNNLWYSSYDSLVLGYTESAVANQLSDRLYNSIEKSIADCNHRRFKWYIYCLGIIVPDEVDRYLEKYPELLI